MPASASDFSVLAFLHAAAATAASLSQRVLVAVYMCSCSSSMVTGMSFFSLSIGCVLTSSSVSSSAMSPICDRSAGLQPIG